MRRIMVLNPKGGSGKSTLATNLASYFALAGKPVVLADFDRQGSSLDWLAVRPTGRPPIHGIALGPDEEPLLPLVGGYLVMDVPAGAHGKLLKRYAKAAHIILIPVLPSPMDIRATARFVRDLLLVGRVSRGKTRVAVVANRVRENTRVYLALERFLAALDIPFVATLRDSQNYIRAAERGLGVFELGAAEAAADIAQWRPLIAWLEEPALVPVKT